MKDLENGQLIANSDNVIVDGEIAWVPAFLGDCVQGNTIRFNQEYLDGSDNIRTEVIEGVILYFERIQDFTRPFIAFDLDTDKGDESRKMGVNAVVWIKCRPVVTKPPKMDRADLRHALRELNDWDI